MDRSRSHAVAFGLGFVTGALLLGMLGALQVRIERLKATAELERLETERVKEEWRRVWLPERSTKTQGND
jgi:uncharacterized membrane protein YciS (DUF1049 family)